MKSLILIFLIITTGALLQQLLPVWPFFGGIKTPILAGIVLHYALRRNIQEVWFVIILSIAMQDGLDIGPFGPALLAFPIIGLLAHRIHNEVFADGLVSQILFGIAIGLLTTFIPLLIYTATNQRPFQPELAIVRLFSSVLLGMATVPLVSLTINKIEDALPKRRRHRWQ